MKKDISKRETPFFCIFKGLSNKQKLLFTSYALESYISAVGVIISPLIVFNDCFFSYREFTYKVHYMMFTLAVLKSLDLMFQAVSTIA